VHLVAQSVWRSADSVAATESKELLMGLGKKAKAGAKVVKGKARKHAGKATGSKRLRAKGKAGEVAGKLKLKAEKAKDSVKHH
jgi:uncharacterized protein YjbJ (UPF0337 family)